MCSNLRLSRSISIVPGKFATYRFYTGLSIGTKLGKFGMGHGTYYNARSESLTTTWRDVSFKRGYIEVTGFLEKGTEFSLKDERVMKAAIMFNDRNEFCLLTEKAEGPVALVHGRMPVILGDNNISTDKWLKEGEIFHLDPYLLISKTA